MICFFSDFTRIRVIKDTANVALDIYDLLYAGDKTDAGVGTMRRRQF
jgi:hypothetical protein